MKLLAVCLLLLQMPGFADNLSLISSDYATYDESVLKLEGNVSLSHQLMLFSATSAKLFDYDKEKTPPFSKALLQKDVTIHLRNNVQMLCDMASIDLTNQKGEIQSNGGLAVYKDLIGQQKVPLEIKGKKASFEMIQSEDSRFLYPLDIKQLSVDDEVSIDYGNSMQLTATSALFQKFDETNRRTIEAFGEMQSCCFTNEQDQIFADWMQLDLLTNDIVMKNIFGELVSPTSIKTSKPSLSIFANHLQFFHDDRKITLRGDVKLIDDDFADLVCDDKVEIFQVKEYDHYVIQTIVCSGNSTIQSHHEELQSLKTSGQMEFSRNSLSLVATKGSTQTLYQNDTLSIFSDVAMIEYDLVDLSLSPKKIHFQGSVKMHCMQESNPLHYGFADELILDPKTNETKLIANKGRKVLFWNEEESLKVSADQIHVFFDEETRKEIIHGIGSVRFTFNSEEEDNFKEIFPSLEGKL